MAAPPPPQGMPMPMPGQQPTPQQIQAMQQQLAADAAKQGLTVPQYIEKLKAQAAQQHQARMQAQAQGQGQQQQQVARPIGQGPPDPAAVAVANFLRSQELKLRTCIFQEKRKDMFRVKRAIRALNSEAYQKARAKNPLLPEVKDRASAENTFKLLPLSVLALRVSKIDPHEGHNHGKKKRVKGLWTVKVEQQQTANDDDHYVWLYEGSQWKQKLYAVGALIAVFAVVLFPLWPMFLRKGVWYLSMGMMGLIGLFFAMSIFRLILFCVTYFAVPPGLWLYPNLFEDVGFFDSFRPVWAWHGDDKKAKKKKKAKKAAAADGKSSQGADSASSPTPTPTTAPATSTSSEPSTAATATRRSMQASVEEADDE